MHQRYVAQLDTYEVRVHRWRLSSPLLSPVVVETDQHVDRRARGSGIGGRPNAGAPRASIKLRASLVLQRLAPQDDSTGCFGNRDE